MLFISATVIPVLMVGVFFISWALTWAVYRAAQKRGWLAIPNERSSHHIPTPRGGGIAIAAAFGIALILLWRWEAIPQTLFLAFGGGGLLVAVISWLDDRRNVHVGIRLVIQFIAVAWSLFFIGDMPTINLGYRQWHLDFLTHLVPLGMVWMINMYNFMDGIDGLAGAQAVIAGLTGGILLAITGAWDIALISWMLAAAAAGFLVWNWHPAKIFMSDVGSILIGFAFAVLSVVSERSGAIPLLIWLILLMVFVVDASFTTIRRFVKGEKWFSGHHNFAFQQLLKQGYSHGHVTLGIIGIQIVLAGLGILSWWKPIALFPSFVGSFVVLGLLWWRIQSRAQAK